MHASHDYCFGHVDARTAVRLAESWLEPQRTGQQLYLFHAQSPPLNQTVTTKYTSKLQLDAGISIEHVEVDIDITTSQLGDVSMLVLTSQYGTQNILLDRLGKVPLGMPAYSAKDLGDARSGRFKYTFMSTHHYGEASGGEWTLELADASPDSTPLNINQWAIRVYGSKQTADDTYFYTDEYKWMLSEPLR